MQPDRRATTRRCPLAPRSTHLVDTLGSEGDQSEGRRLEQPGVAPRLPLQSPPESDTAWDCVGKNAESQTLRLAKRSPGWPEGIPARDHRLDRPTALIGPRLERPARRACVRS